MGIQGVSFRGVCGAMRLYARVLFVGAWDPAVCSENEFSCEDQGCWCSCLGTSTADPDHWLVGLCATKNQNI